jgi:hypothetical protein
MNKRLPFVGKEGRDEGKILDYTYLSSIYVMGLYP